MGLDMYALKTKFKPESEVGFSVPEGVAEGIFYWRKHPNLHGWMEKLYLQKGGIEEFNCVNVQLTAKDLEDLKKAILSQELPSTSGFFFGASYENEDDRLEDLNFIKEAQAAIEEGYTIFYTSWW